jgi:hypothetical protein
MIIYEDYGIVIVANFHNYTEGRSDSLNSANHQTRTQSLRKISNRAFKENMLPIARGQIQLKIRSGT